MKKILISLLLIPALLICLAGCAGETQTDAAPSQTAAAVTETEKSGTEADMIALLLSSGTVSGDDAEAEYAWSASRDRLSAENGRQYADRGGITIALTVTGAAMTVF